MTLTLTDKITRARKLIESITDDMPADEIAAIEARHLALIEQIGADENRRLATLPPEQAERYRALPAGTRLSSYLDDAARAEAPMDNKVGNDMGGRAGNAELYGEALFARFNPSHNLSERARPFFGLGMPEIARRLVNQAGSGLSPSEVVTRAFATTSDYPLILENFSRRVLANAYPAPESGLKKIARQVTVKDFRAKTTVRLSGFSALEQVNEHGEYKQGNFEEGKESYKIATFGKIFALTRQAIINDDMNAFGSVLHAMGESARELEAQKLVELLESNPNLGDGKALFHADHKNLGTAAALSVDSLSAARLAMRHQRGLSGELISVTPYALIVPAELETKAEKLLAEIAATKVDDSNPFGGGKLQLVVEPRLTSSTGWYVAANPGERAAIDSPISKARPASTRRPVTASASMEWNSRYASTSAAVSWTTRPSIRILARKYGITHHHHPAAPRGAATIIRGH